ncbi:MAG TPA: autotransporter-associated beta strand repeat-containing protein, partial [Prosthecobacter sp.]|nr:autotransporter-associated beta strand repeat-containing protein [Prosthecobacter sp.]
FPGSVGNGKIKVAIDYVGGLGPITSTLTGAGTEANPYIYTIYTTDYIADLDDPETPQNETEVNTNRGNNPRNLANFVTGDFLVAQILTASTSAGSGANADELLPDTNDYAATFLSGGTEDSGSQELDWARNGSTVADAFNDGFVMAVASSSYSNNAWNVNLNTNISASGTRINSTTNSLRFANSGAASVNLAGGVNIVQTGGILVSPTVGANDSAITGVGQLVTENEGNLQNFLIHQYNTAGDLVITAPIAERAEFVRTGRLASNIANHSLRLLHSLATTTDLAPGMTVSGTGIAAGSIIEEILDGHTVKLDRNTTQTAGQRNIVIFTGGGGSVTLLASFGDTTGGSARRRIYGLVVPADPERNRQERVSSSDLYIGLPVVGPGIPAGATIASIPNDADIILNVDHFYTGIVSNMSFKPSVGVEKLGPGTLILGGQNTYTGVTFVGDGMLRAQSLTDGGVAGSLGISNNGAGNLVFNGGTLQYVGQNASTNRAFTLTEFAVLNIGHERTRVTFSGAVSGTDRLEKSGSGTLIMTGNAGLSELRVDEGTLRVQIVDANPAPATFSASNFGTSNLMSLRMSGGVFELRGAQEGNIAQTYGGPFFLEEGASEIRVISVKGYDPNNLNAGAQNRAATLNLMGGEEIVSVTRSAGGTVRFMEMPEAGAGAANITLAIPVLERQKILPWATYGDISSSFINDFATVLITTAAVVNADSSAGGFQQDVGSIPDEWREGTSAANIDASEGADFSYNMPLLDTTNPLRNDFALNTLRYVTKTDASMLIDTGKTLRLIGGAILVGGDVQGGQKEIVGGGRLMGGAVSTEGREILLHNYNAGAPFHLGVSIVDEVFVSNAQPFNKTGSVEAGSRSLYMALSKANYQRLAEGMLVTGPGLPPGTVIATLPSADFGLIILSQAATSTHSGVAYTFTASTGFVQTGVGTTILSGTNTYSGNTFVHGGVLRLNSANAVPGGIGVTGGTSHIVIEGGVLGLATSNFTRGLGTAKDQVEFKGSGGFAAYDQDRTVTFGGTLSKLRYGNDGFVPDGSSFVLGSHDATHKVTLMNPLDLGTISQAIRTPNGPAEIEGELGGNLVGLGRLV